MMSVVNNNKVGFILYLLSNKKKFYSSFLVPLVIFFKIDLLTNGEEKHIITHMITCDEETT